MREGASKQSSDLKNYTAPGPRPPVLKFLDPPLVTTDVFFTPPLPHSVSWDFVRKHHNYANK